jgi:hypothetical protein
VLLVRETPLHLGHLRLLVQVADLGAVVMPPMPAFYHRPQTLQEVIDQTVNRALDMLGVELDHDLFARWQGPPTEPAHRSLIAGDHRVNGSESGHSGNTFVAVNGTKPPEE